MIMSVDDYRVFVGTRAGWKVGNEENKSDDKCLDDRLYRVSNLKPSESSRLDA